MIRFILRREWADSVTPDKGESLFTLDADIPELEKLLKSGGSGDYGFERTTLIGAEVKNEPQTKEG